jgi:putative glutamine amidotransferase
MRNLTIYSAIYNCHHPLDVFFPDAKLEVVDKPGVMEPPGILILHGGSDISPQLYNKEMSAWSEAMYKPSVRDTIEWELIKEAREKNIFICGWCRGAQMLCAAAGGYLIQDITGHEGSAHSVTTADGQEFPVNTIHHQMQAPWGVTHEMLATTPKPLSTHYLDVDESVEVPNEPEAVYYPELRGLAIQWHPEMLAANCRANSWMFSVLKEKL